jgi:hypothetical protein
MAMRIAWDEGLTRIDELRPEKLGDVLVGFADLVGGAPMNLGQDL